jgi:ubiquinone biosynthesis protein COQ4
MKLFLYLRFFKACWAVIKNPYETEQVAKTSDFLANPEKFKAVLDEMRKTPQFREWLLKKPQPPRVSKTDLKLFPEGTFGRALYQHLNENNLDPVLYPLDPKNEIDYIRNYYRQTHDIWHVATGFNTTVADELGLMTFSYAQNRSPAAAMIVVLGFLHGIIFNNKDLPSYFEKSMQGWNLGNKAQKLMPVDWENKFSLPLEQVRQELGVLV